jgi:hypothetical protein
MVTGIIAWIRRLGDSPINGTVATIIFGISFVFLLVVFYIRQRRKQTAIIGRRRMRMIIYVPILAGLAFCIWAYFIGSRVLEMNNNVRHLRAQMVRYVLPRRLTPEQIDTIGEYLSGQERNQVVMQIISRDEEAGSYRSDIQRALEKGGWAVADIRYADDVQEGVSITMQSPIAPPITPYDRLHPKLTPVQILAESFKRAGVQIQSMGGGSGIATTTTTITISIGRRRRDAWAVAPPNYEAGRRSNTPAITDDDFGFN